MPSDTAAVRRRVDAAGVSSADPRAPRFRRPTVPAGRSVHTSPRRQVVNLPRDSKRLDVQTGDPRRDQSAPPAVLLFAPNCPRRNRIRLAESKHLIIRDGEKTGRTRVINTRAGFILSRLD